MKAAIFKGKGSILIEERPRPAITEPTDAIVRVVLACVCGSDLWPFRGIDEPRSEELDRFKDLWDGALVDDRVT